MLSDLSRELVIEPKLCPLHATVEACGCPVAKWLRRLMYNSVKEVMIRKADRPHRQIGSVHLPAATPCRSRPAAIRHERSVAWVMLTRTAELVAEPLADTDCHGVTDQPPSRSVGSPGFRWFCPAAVKALELFRFLDRGHNENVVRVRLS